MLPHCKVAGYVFCVFFMYIKETKKERDKKNAPSKSKTQEKQLNKKAMSTRQGSFKSKRNPKSIKSTFPKESCQQPNRKKKQFPTKKAVSWVGSKSPRFKNQFLKRFYVWRNPGLWSRDYICS